MSAAYHVLFFTLSIFLFIQLVVILVVEYFLIYSVGCYFGVVLFTTFRIRQCQRQPGCRTVICFCRQFAASVCQLALLQKVALVIEVEEIVAVWP